MKRKYKITLKDKVSGYSRTFYEDYDIDEDGNDGAYYMWNDGNYSCDCNRSLFLWEWKKEELECSGETNQIELVELTAC